MPASAEPFILGFNFPSWWKNSYASAPAAESLRRLKATGAAWIAVTPTRYMPSASASTIVTTDATASDESLRAVIRTAKSLRLRVAMKPHVDLAGGGPRALIHAHNGNAWFRAYREMVAHYALLAKEEEADLFIVGTELALMAGPDHTDDWKRVIREARDVYPGKLTYASNWYDAMSVPFWADLDLIGIDGYYPLIGGHDVKVLRASWKLYESSIAALAHGYGKPVLFTEVGLSSQKGANHRPWDYGVFGELDLEVQRAYMQSFLDTFGRKPWFAGFLYWAWDLDPAAGGPTDKSMTVQGKPALETLKAYFKDRGAPEAMAPTAGLAEAIVRAQTTAPTP